MKHFQLGLLCCLWFSYSYCQTGTNSYGKIDVEITKGHRRHLNAQVEIRSPFPGGDSSWVQSLETKLNQSTRLGKGAKRGKYLVTVQFVVAKDGIISDVRALTKNGYGMEEEVLRAIKVKVPWVPAPQGVPVRPYRTSSATPKIDN